MLVSIYIPLVLALCGAFASYSIASEQHTNRRLTLLEKGVFNLMMMLICTIPHSGPILYMFVYQPMIAGISYNDQVHLIPKNVLEYEDLPFFLGYLVLVFSGAFLCSVWSLPLCVRNILLRTTYRLVYSKESNYRHALAYLNIGPGYDRLALIHLNLADKTNSDVQYQLGVYSDSGDKWLQLSSKQGNDKAKERLVNLILKSSPNISFDKYIEIERLLLGIKDQNNRVHDMICDLYSGWFETTDHIEKIKYH